MPARWLVDGMNVIGSHPDGWWRDRAGAARRLAADLKDLAARSGDQVAVVFEGTEFAGLPPSPDSPVPDSPVPGRPVPDSPVPESPVPDGAVRVLYARRRGRDAADDRIVEEVEHDPDPGSLTVVTSDRELIRRVSELGAKTVGPRTLLDRLRGPTTD